MEENLRNDVKLQESLKWINFNLRVNHITLRIDWFQTENL